MIETPPVEDATPPADVAPAEAKGVAAPAPEVAQAEAEAVAAPAPADPPEAATDGPEPDSAP